MNTITINNKKFKSYISSKRLNKCVQDTADILNAKYKDVAEENCPVFVVVLNGSARFANDLFNKLTFRCKLEYCKYHSYNNTNSAKLIADLPVPYIPRGHDIILIEDLIDTGQTIKEIIKSILNTYPYITQEKIGVITLLNKYDNHSSLYDQFIVNKYSCINIDNSFIVGYGMDYNGYGRELNEIYIEV